MESALNIHFKQQMQSLSGLQAHAILHVRLYSGVIFREKRPLMERKGTFRQALRWQGLARLKCMGAGQHESNESMQS